MNHSLLRLAALLVITSSAAPTAFAEPDRPNPAPPPEGTEAPLVPYPEAAPVPSVEPTGNSPEVSRPVQVPVEASDPSLAGAGSPAPPNAPAALERNRPPSFAPTAPPDFGTAALSPSTRYLSPTSLAALDRIERRKAASEALIVIGVATSVAAVAAAGYEIFCLTHCRRGVGGAVLGAAAGVAIPALAVGIPLYKSARRSERQILEPRRLSLLPAPTQGGGKLLLHATF